MTLKEGGTWEVFCRVFWFLFVLGFLFFILLCFFFGLFGEGDILELKK